MIFAGKAAGNTDVVGPTVAKFGYKYKSDDWLLVETREVT